MIELQNRISRSVKASKNEVLTVEYLAKKYKIPEEYVEYLAEKHEDLAVSNGVVMVKREKALTAAFAGAATVILFGIVVVLPGWIG